MQIILTDCFDTVIYRKVFPEFVKIKWAEKVCSEYNLVVSPRQLYNLRVQVEKDLMSTNKRAGFDAEFKVLELYKTIIERLYVSGIITSMADMDVAVLHNIEKDIEISVQLPNKKIIEKLFQLKKQGYKIYLVSDFYMGKQDVGEFLAKLNILELFDGMYISSDYCRTKVTGELYKCVLNDLKIPPQACEMWGDNKHSDYEIPKKMGIKVRYNNANSRRKMYKKQSAQYRGSGVKFFQNYKKIFFRNYKYNYENYAFLFYDFIWKLADKCNREKIKHLFFLSREGQFLKVLFDKYCELNGLEIKTSYLQVSRNSTFMPSLCNIENETFNRLFRENNDASLYEFLVSLSFTDADIKSIEKSMSLDIYKPLMNTRYTTEFSILIKNEKFIKLYDTKRLEQKILFKKYMHNLGYNESDILYIVDVGWKGTMQDNLMKIYDGGIAISGFYLGLTNPGSIAINSHKFGLLFDCLSEAGTKRCRIFSYNCYDYEQLLRASHNRVNNYINKGNDVDIVYDSKDETAYYKQYLQEYQSYILDKFIKIDAKTKNLPITLEKYDRLCQFIFIKMLNKMTRRDFNLIWAGKSDFADAFGKVYTGMPRRKKWKQFIIEKLRAKKIKLIYLLRKDKNG